MKKKLNRLKAFHESGQRKYLIVHYLLGKTLNFNLITESNSARSVMNVNSKSNKMISEQKDTMDRLAPKFQIKHKRTKTKKLDSLMHKSQPKLRSNTKQDQEYSKIEISSTSYRGLESSSSANLHGDRFLFDVINKANQSVISETTGLAESIVSFPLYYSHFSHRDTTQKESMKPNVSEIGARPTQ